MCIFYVFYNQKTSYVIRISDWSSDVCASDLPGWWAATEAVFRTRRSLVPELPAGVKSRPNCCPDREKGPFRHESTVPVRPTPVGYPGAAGRSGHAGRLRYRQGSSRPQQEGAGRIFRGHQGAAGPARSEEHTSELKSLMRISYAVFCL